MVVSRCRSLVWSWYSPIQWPWTTRLPKQTSTEPALPGCPEGWIYAPPGIRSSRQSTNTLAHLQPLLVGRHVSGSQPFCPRLYHGIFLKESSNYGPFFSRTLFTLRSGFHHCLWSLYPYPGGSRSILQSLPPHPPYRITIGYSNCRGHVHLHVSELQHTWGHCLVDLSSSPEYVGHSSISYSVSEFTSGYHPQMNRQAERKIQEIVRSLRSYCHSHQTQPEPPKTLRTNWTTGEQNY